MVDPATFESDATFDRASAGLFRIGPGGIGGDEGGVRRKFRPELTGECCRNPLFQANQSTCSIPYLGRTTGSDGINITPKTGDPNELSHR